DSLVNKESGLAGVSGISGDMRDVMAAADRGDAPAREAIDLFCYQARKHIGALSAVLGGLDRLVFTGGIGEHAAAIRGGIAAGTEYLGVEVDHTRNDAHERVISPDGSPVEVMVIPTNEDLMIAQLVVSTIQAKPQSPR
ncbi:MAG TPA: hypothetical protein VFQ54_06355, partial [Thermomicrobiales bacterium]|nr:hypothetical protein [Thermomicrobiales bacterium]